jgi:hypothetical protein
MPFVFIWFIWKNLEIWLFRYSPPQELPTVGPTATYIAMTEKPEST